MKKNWRSFLCCLLLSWTFSVQAIVLIVSDLDDTIKMTQVRSPLSAVWNTLLGPESFSELIKHYQNMKQHYEAQGEEVEFVYLSSSPRFIDAQSWLDYHEAPKGTVIQRGAWDLLKKGKQFKKEQLKKIIQAKQQQSTQQDNGKPLTLFLFGDNGEKDPEVFDHILNDPDLSLDPEKSHAFVRRVSAHQEDVPGVDYFLSESELIEHPVFTSWVPEAQKKLWKSWHHEGFLIPDYVQQSLGLSYPNCPSSTPSLMDVPF
jgi:phosphatidate phosphatase APP1